MNPPASSIDIVILTALREEYEQVLEVSAGASEGSSWQVRPGPLGHEVAFRSFVSENGQPLQVAVTWATNMGGVAAASLAERLIAEYRPRCLAMCGVCAGRRGDTNIGDVIVADRVWIYDVGKKKVEYDAQGKRTERFQGDMPMYNLRDDWHKAAQSFRIAPDIVNSWGSRPMPTDMQAHWILERLARGEDPRTHADKRFRVPNWPQVMDIVWKKEWLEDGSLTLTEAGRKHIEKLLMRHDDVLPELGPFNVHVGPIGTGNQVIQDPQIFDRLSETMRKVRGLEMEAAAIGAVAHANRDLVPYSIVMKGVMDHADEGKNDTAKTFAARASAECLIAFLRKHLPPIDHFGDILDPGTAKRPSTPAPSHLLHAKYRYISFYRAGRADILQRLRSFCTAGDPTSVWLIHGDGGMGKTRLMIEFCEELRANGWVAGFLRAAPNLERFVELVNADAPTCVAIDYAESRPELTAMLLEVARIRERGAPLRIVLLARNAGDWWTGLLAEDSAFNVLLATHIPEEMGSLVATHDRETIVKDIAAQLAGATGIPMPSCPLPPLEDKRFERTLYLHLAALAWLQGSSFAADTLLNNILEHEERFWLNSINSSLDRIDKKLFVDDMRRAVAAVTLRGGLASETQGKSLVERINDHVDRRLLEYLRQLYPGSDSTFASPLEPDLLGEGMVWRTMTILQNRGDAPTIFLDKIFQDADQHVTTAGFTVLGRLSEEYSGETRPWVAHLLKDNLVDRAVPALEAAKSLGAKTAHAWVGYELAKALERSGTEDLAVRLAAVSIPEKTVSLREVSAWVLQKHFTSKTLASDSIQGLMKRAQLLNDLGVQAGALGQRDEALVLANKAVAIYRLLAERYPDTFEANLGRSLSNLGLWQSKVGQREMALASTQEAVAIARKLVTRDATTYLPEMARSLANLGNMQDGLGQREAALASTQEAADILRKLVEREADKFLPDLAANLSNLGAMQSGLGQREAALESTLAAAEIQRVLVEREPDAFLPDLAATIDNLGLWQCASGQLEAALTSTQEAVKIRRLLAARQPDAFRPDLARSLHNLAVTQGMLGEHDAALVSTQEALDIVRKLAARNPDAFLPHLAMSLNNLSQWQSALRQPKAALASAQESVDTCRKLAENTPDAFLPDLAHGLHTLGHMKNDMGDSEAALASLREAVSIYRELAASNADAFLQKLAASVSTLAVVQSAVSRHEAALEFAQEAVEILRKLVARQPGAYLPDLARHINNLSNMQSAFGQHNAALASIQEAIDIRRKLVARYPDAFLPNLATSLYNLSMRQGALGQHNAALASIQEAIDIERKLVARHADAFLPNLAKSLHKLGVGQSHMGQLEAAVASTQEAVGIWRRLVVRNPDAFLPELANSLFNLALWHHSGNQHKQARTVAQEAFTAFWTLLQQYPQKFHDNARCAAQLLRHLHHTLGEPLDPTINERISTFETKDQ